LAYEMLTGKKAFEGKGQASLIAAIIERDPPPLPIFQIATPSALDRVIRVCLAKDPDERWQTMRDLLRELQWIANGQSQAMPAAATEGRRTVDLIWKAVAVVLALALVAVLAVNRRAPSAPVADSPVLSLSVVQPSGVSFTRNFAFQSLSPDGRRIAFSARGEGGKPTLWIRSLDLPNAQSLRGTADALSPFWSPNGRFVGFFDQDKLKTIDVTSGAIQVLADASGATRYGAWSKDDVIVFYNTVAGVNELTRISASGGKPSTAVKLDLS